MTKPVVVVALALAVCAPQPAWCATQYALLIGVSQYEARIAPLPGARNDVALIERLLTTRFGFEQSNVVTLVDRQATRRAIISAIRQLAQQATPDDFVFLHYSGHGSQAPDTSGDESDGLDETILPYDARTRRVPDITDDEINSLVGEFRARSVIVVLDSCHSGTGTRGGLTQVTQRWAPPDDRAELYEGIGTRGTISLPVGETHVFFAAAQDNESELDGPFGPDMMPLGLFTAAMLGVLSQSSPDVTPRQLIEGVDEIIAALKARAGGMKIPEPNLEASVDRHDQPMFALRNAPATPIHPAAIATPGFVPVRSIHVSRNGSPDAEFARRLAPLIGEGISVASSFHTADAVVDRPSSGGYDVYGPKGTVQVARGLTRERAIQGGMESARMGELDFLAEIVRIAPSLADLVSMQSTDSSMQLRIQAAGVRGTREQALSTRTVRVTANTRDHRLRFYVEGEPRTRSNSLQLEVQSTVDCYLTILSVSAIGKVVVLLPNPPQEASGFLSDGLIRAGVVHSIPDTLASDNAAGFHLDYAPPDGVDRVVGVCFRQLERAQAFRSQLARLETGAAPDGQLFRAGERGLTGITPGQPLNAPDTPPPATTALGSVAGSAWSASHLSLEVSSR